MAAKIDNFADIPRFISNGVAELTHGTDDSGIPVVYDILEVANILKDPAKYWYSDQGMGYIFFRYFAKQVSDGNDTLPADTNLVKFIGNTLAGAVIQVQGSDGIIRNSGSNVTISSADGSDTVYNSGSSTIIDLGAGGDSISNYGTA